MAVKKNGNAFTRLGTLFNAGAIGTFTDGQLLERFTTGRGEPRELAFAALVERHGPYVLRVCRAVLRDENAAEDAFQATFLALARKAGSLWAQDSLAPWLHQAAYRAALHDRSAALTRRAHERAAAALRSPSVAPAYPGHDADVEQIIHEEIGRLPGRFRVAVVLCDLEGRTHEQAARHIGCAIGTVKSRLDRGRKRLRGRLVRRGVAPAAALAAAFAGSTAQAAVPTALAESTVIYAANATAVPASIAAITEGVLRSMVVRKVKLIVTAGLIAGALAAGVVALAQSGNDKPAQGTGKAEQAPRVVVTSPKVMDVTLTQQYVCQIHSHRHIRLRALEKGFLREIRVKDGQTVKAGDVLFQIDPVLADQRLAVLVAERESAQIKYDNTKKLFDDKVASEDELKRAEAELRKAQAKVDLLKAKWEFARVKAPFGGIIERLEQQEGSLVEEGDVLTSLSDNSVMWVYFNVPESRYLEYMAHRKEREQDRVELRLGSGAKFPHPGKIGAIQADFNSQTGNIPFRADFPNPDRLLRHGQVGTILIHQKLRGATVIPMRATFEVSDKRYVYVVGKDNVARQREIVVQYETDDLFVIKKGVDTADRIVLVGVRQVHDGEKVNYAYRSPDQVIGKPKDGGE
jgi:membrane fusion protein (multidrug efflux system)